MEKGRAYGPCCASSEVRRTQSGKSLDLAAIDPLFLGLRQGFSIFFFCNSCGKHGYPSVRCTRVAEHTHVTL